MNVLLNLNNNNVFQQNTRDSVGNISNYNSTEAQHSLLSKGLNFCPTPGEPNFGEIRQDMDHFHMGLRRKAYFAVPSFAGSSLPPQDAQWQLGEADLDEPFDERSFRIQSNWSPRGPLALEAFIANNEASLNKVKIESPRENNLSQAERASIEELFNNNDIIIQKADKGCAIVIMNLTDYIEEAEEQLQSFYKKVDENLTMAHHNLIGRTVANMLEVDEISEKCYNYLVAKGTRTSLFYLLPKIHKNKFPPPGRPILSANDSPTEKISALVDHFLRPLVPSIKSYVKDTNHFLNIIQDLGTLPENALLVTLDVSCISISHIMRDWQQHKNFSLNIGPFQTNPA